MPHCASFVGGLSGLHTYFTSHNRTTYEHFRSRKSAADNPYDLGCAGNWRQVSTARNPAACVLARDVPWPHRVAATPSAWSLSKPACLCSALSAQPGLRSAAAACRSAAP